MVFRAQGESLAPRFGRVCDEVCNFGAESRHFGDESRHFW